MAKVMKTWDTKRCIKGTELARFYYCSCNDCQHERTEQNQRAIQEQKERLKRIRESYQRYWLDFDSRDKDTTHSLFTWIG